MSKKRKSIVVSYTLEGDDGDGVYDLPTEVHVSYQACDASNSDMVERPKVMKVALTDLDTNGDTRDDIIAAVNAALGIS